MQSAMVKSGPNIRTFDAAEGWHHRTILSLGLMREVGPSKG